MIIDLYKNFVFVNDFGVDYVLSNSYLFGYTNTLPKVVDGTNIQEWFSNVFVLLNNLAQTNQFSIQAAIAFGTVGTVVLALCPIRLKPKVEGELYYAIIDHSYAGVKKATIKEVQSKEKVTFLLAEIKNTGDIDITLRDNKFEVVNSFFGIIISSRAIVTLGLFKDEYIQRSVPGDYLLVPRRKITNFSSRKNHVQEHNAIRDLENFYKKDDPTPLSNICKILLLLKLCSLKVILQDELGKKFKLSIDDNVINQLKELLQQKNLLM